MPLAFNADGTVVNTDVFQASSSGLNPVRTFQNAAGFDGPVGRDGSFFPNGLPSQGQTPTSQTGGNNDGTFNRDGVTFDRFGRRLDSLGNLAFGSGGGSGVPGDALVSGAPITQQNFLREDGTFDWVGYANTQTQEPRFFVPTNEGQNITLPFLQGTGFELPSSAAPLFDLNTAQFLVNSSNNQRDFNETERRFNLEFPEGQRQANLAAFGRSFAPGGQFLSVR